jgi:hypothetical protein
VLRAKAAVMAVVLRRAYGCVKIDAGPERRRDDALNDCGGIVELVLGVCIRFVDFAARSMDRWARDVMKRRSGAIAVVVGLEDVTDSM